MSSRDTDQFKERKVMVEQVLKDQKHHFIDDYKGIATVKQLQELTGLNDQAIRRVIKALNEDKKVKLIKDKSEIVLLK